MPTTDKDPNARRRRRQRRQIGNTLRLLARQLTRHLSDLDADFDALATAISQTQEALAHKTNRKKKPDVLDQAAAIVNAMPATAAKLEREGRQVLNPADLIN